MSLLVVETQHADYLFACPSAAESFAAKQRRHWSEMCPGIGRVPIDPVPLTALHRFSASNENCPLEPGPGQEHCRRVRRHVRRWWDAKDAWWNTEAER
jgi:hypothetical protein